MMLVSVSSIPIIAIFIISWVDHNYIINVVTANRAERLPPIETPLREHRQFRGIKLANGLQVLLVNDSRARKSTAAMVVAVGSINDEKEEPGIANLVRYLLLSACGKYRQKNEFKKYLEERGGELSSELTTSEAEHKHHYAFEVDHDYFELAIKRFAKYFIEPLFERVDDVTLRAALGNSLAKKHDDLMSADTMRIAKVLKLISEEDHRYNNLSYGTIEMLNEYAGVGREPLDDKLMNFVRKWYSANLMRLVVIGDEKLDVLEEVVTTRFSPIKNTGVEKLTFSYEQHPWKSDDQLKHKLCIVPAVNDSMREIRLTFRTSDVLSQYKISPEKYAIQFIKHRGAGTLGFVLPDRGLCKSRSVRAEYQTYAGIGFFTILMEPTEEGLKEVDRILELTFQYINLLKNEGVEKWFYDEEKTIDELNSSIIDKQSYTAQNLASAMHDISIGHIITYKYSRGPWDAEPVHKFLSYLTPDNVNISVVDKSCESAADIKTEPWYGTKYKIERIPEGIIKKWASPTNSFPELKIPSFNEFIPDSPDDMDSSTFVGDIPLQPQIIHTSSISRIWYKPDYDFPLVQIALNIVSPIMNTSLLNHPFTDVYARILNTSLKEYEYSAESAGYFWDIGVTPVGFDIVLSGPVFNKLEVLLEKVLFKLSHFKDIVSEEIFEKCTKEVVSVLEDRGAAKDSHRAAIHHLTHIFINGTWTSANVIRLPLQKELQRQKFEKFTTKLLSRIHVQGLIYGACDEEEAKVVANTVEETFKQTSRSALPQQMLNLFRRCVRMESGKSFVYQSHGDSPEHVYHVFFQLGSRKTSSADIRHEMTGMLLHYIISEACLKILPPRVLGSSECRIDSIKQIIGFVIIISSQMHPRHMDMRAERFLEIMWEKLRDMSDEAFNTDKMRYGMHHIVETDDRTNIERFHYYFNEIRKRTYAFLKRSTELKKLEKIEKKDVIAFFKEILAKGSSKRRKIAVYVYSNTLVRNAPRNKTADDDGTNSEDELQNTKIEDAAAFKNTLLLLPTPLPKMNLVLERQIDVID